MPVTASFDKGAAIEEKTDLVFFRPLGLRIARLCMPTSISPDQVTMVALATGLIAGHLLFYNSVALNVLGVALFVVSDVFDSADGQLARMRGTSTRFGKILDGISDGARFANLYVHLMARLIVGGTPWWLVVPLGVLAGLAHARQSRAVDYIRQLYLYLAEGGGEFNLADDMAALPGGWWRNAQVRFYRNYLRSASRLLPQSVEVVQMVRDGKRIPHLADRWAVLELPVVRQCAWIGQNIRFVVMAATIVPGHPAAFLWVTLVPMSAVLAAILFVHERRAAMVIHPDAPRLAQAA